MSASKSAFCENRYAANMSDKITSPIQNAEKFPATRPDKMFSDAPPWPEALVTSRTWRELVLTKIFVNSMMSAPASVPQDMIAASTHQRLGKGLIVTGVTLAFASTDPDEISKSPSSSLLAMKMTMMEMMDVIQTKSVSGASQLISFSP